MPTIETIKLADAPQPPKKLSKIANEFQAALNALKKDEILRLSPDEGKSIRGLKTSVGRMASNTGVKVESYDDGQYVYVRKQS